MSTLPGINPSGPPDEQSFGRDLATIFTNPALLLGAAGVLAPEEVNVGGNRWWRIAPRLRGLSALMGQSREANMQDQYANELAGINRVPQPPPTAPESEPPPLPPGMDRATYMSKLSPGMIRQMGNNPLAWRQVATFADAQELAARQKGKYDIAYNQLVAMGHDPAKARTLALGMARENRDLTEPFATATPQALQATGIEGELRLQQAKEDQKIQTALTGGLQSADYNAQKAWLQQNPDVNPTRLFGKTGDFTRAITYYTEQAASMNDTLRRTKGTQMEWHAGLDQNGKMAISAQERPAQTSPEQIQSGLMAQQEMLNMLVKSGTIPAEIAKPLQFVVTGAMRTGDAKTYQDLNSMITGLYTTQMHVNAQRSQMDIARIEALTRQADQFAQTVQKQLDSPRFSVLKQNGYERAPKGDVEDYIRLTQIQRTIQSAIGRMAMAPDARTALIEYGQIRDAANAVPDQSITRLYRVNGKSWDDVRKKLPPNMPPAEIEQARQQFIQQASLVGR